jgi:NTP pyrophosphatase (non-canonical NTP hydrolase)
MPADNLINDLAKQCREDSLAWFPDVADDIPFFALAMAGEVGEFANLVKKVQRGSLDAKSAGTRHDLAMELTDVVIYALNLAALLKVDLHQTYKMKRAENVKRFGKDTK